MNAIVLCADDFGLSDGVSRAIVELADAARISATSAMVTTEAWPRSAEVIAGLRSRVAVGLHVNMTLGVPLTEMVRLAPDSRFPPLRTVVQQALRRQLIVAELTAEIRAQIQEFRERSGCMPDFLDGHQHVHALPQVRQAVVAAAGAFDWPGPLFVRSPSDSFVNIVARRSEVAKSLTISALSAGFRSYVRAAGLVTNSTFAGVSSFSRQTAFRDELIAAMRRPGRCHLIMCHPGYADDALRRLDPVVERREDEFETLLRDDTLPERIWRPSGSTRILMPHG